MPELDGGGFGDERVIAHERAGVYGASPDRGGLLRGDLDSLDRRGRDDAPWSFAARLR